MAAIVFLDEIDPSEVNGLVIGAVVTYNDMCNDNRGLVYEIGAMVKVAYIDEPGLTEVLATDLELDNKRTGWKLTGETESEGAAFAARDIALTARSQRMEKQEQSRNEQEALRAEGHKVLEKLMPPGTKAALVATLVEDKSDMMSDYFGHINVREVLLAFSTHARDLFPEMRKAAKTSGFEEVAHLIEPNSKHEHREKYSMGAGYYLKDGYRDSTGWHIRKIPLDYTHGKGELALLIMKEGGNQLPNGNPKPPTTAAPVTAGVVLQKNTQYNGIELIFPGKPSAAIRDRLKSVGFRWHRVKKLWYAKDKPAQRAVAEELAGETPTPKQQADTVKAVQQANGDKLRNLADKMQGQIDDKLDPGCGRQNPTARRARMAASMIADGESLQRVQMVLYGMADDLDGGTLPEILQRVDSKAVITDILQLESYYQAYPDNGRHMGDEATKKRLRKAGVSTDNMTYYAEALTNYIKPVSAEQKQAKAIKELEQDLIGVKIDGFFPTPKPVIDLMIERAEISVFDSTLLEPSAGKGDIADALREQFPDNPLTVLEINDRLRKILESKNYSILEWDFMDLGQNARFDRILMNPPFEHLTDIDHIQRAYEHLRPGGRIVCLMSESPFFRSDRKAADFRAWLEEVNGYAEKLEEGSFKGAESFRQTGINSRMVIIDR